MGTPIKERGIRWVESYGDKSTHLKTEMEKQIGPGSYFRWEGHDSTTGNDYYVVVSPGYSPKHGYHFFAGLRKMPADHGASGKKFNNMRSALYYAYDTWRVPKPESMPAGWHGYDVSDIANKDIVLEGVHSSSSEKPTKSAGILILSPSLKKKCTDVEAMAVQTMAGGLSSSRMGSQIMAQQYCHAYKAAPVMGFLPALFSTMRLMGLDSTNFNRSEAASTENRINPATKVPLSPLVATCQHPDPEEFRRRYEEGAAITERLYDMPSSFEKKRDSYATFKPPLEAEDPDDVQVVTWGDMSTNMYVHIPANAHDEDFIGRWQALLPMQPRTPKPKKRSVAQDHEYSVAVNAENIETYQKFVDELTDRIRKRSHGQARPLITPRDDDGKNFVRLWLRAKELAGDPALARQHGIAQGFDADQPYLQIIRQRGSQMLDYDANGLPMKLVVQSPSRRTWQQETKENNKATRPIYYVLADRVGMVDRNVPGFAEAWRQKDQPRCRELLAKFHDLADRNNLPYPPTHRDVYDHRTMAPLVSNPTVRVPMLNNQKLPVDPDGKVMSPEEIASLDGPYYRDAPMLSGAVVKGHKMPGNKLGARWFDPSANQGLGGYVFDDTENMLGLPTPAKFQADKNGAQQITGAPTIIERSAMYRKGKVNFHVVKSGRQAKIRFDGRIQPERARKLEAAGFKFVASKSFANGQWAGNFNNIPDDYAVEKGQVDGFYTVQRGETTLYDPNSRGKAIPGNAYDVMYGPSMQDMLSPGMPAGFGIAYVAHKAVLNPESHFDPNIEELTVRQQSPSQFIESPPSEEEMNRQDGDIFDPSFVGMNKGKVAWKDSLAGFRYLKEKLQIPDELAFPFCRMTDMDLKVIKDRASAGKRTYEQYKDREAEIPDNLRELYSYGRVLSSCSEKGEAIPNEVFQLLAKELADPASSLKPKQAQEGGRDALMALLVIPGNVPASEALGNADRYYWGSPGHAVDDLRGNGVILAPNYKGDPGSYGDEEIDTLFPGVHVLRTGGYQFVAVNYRHESGSLYSQPSMATRQGPPTLTYGDDKFLSSMGVRDLADTGPEEITEEDLVDPLPTDRDTGRKVSEEELSLQGESIAWPEEGAYATPEEEAQAVPAEEVPEAEEEEWLPGRILVDLTRPGSFSTTTVAVADRLMKMSIRLEGKGLRTEALIAKKIAKKIGRA